MNSLLSEETVRSVVDQAVVKKETSLCQVSLGRLWAGCTFVNKPLCRLLTPQVSLNPHGGPILSADKHRDERKNAMRTIASVIVAAILSTIIAGCFGESLVARGYVTARTTNEVTIDAGSSSGIQPGDTLRVYTDNGKRSFFSGKVKVVKVLGRNAAIAEVLSGNAARGDRVEKWQSR